ncbi:family 76 glycoside hydrolase [Cryphonectria parasitica EP155]|uniref:Family 76 glycoside hydrolase n=1 Tax=Cryphonectria parasitica (strain ATCC 38755 / EP155) TaxID=660469 RepID=A0A9P5CPR7_CRYP1|nr:family 76 glycoside hydrolase [Cryphonectria parasitica EP155]KAF3765260.1 family 76 glycoside hydrolase [Cryphonectria parasitica EP155]
MRSNRSSSSSSSRSWPSMVVSPTYLLDKIIEVLDTMQDDYFQPWLGTWPTAIDWTAAVMGTHVSGGLSTISRALDLLPGTDRWASMGKENTVTLFFSQVLGFYFGQDSFAIRNEAYDDILWVVLGWLETIQFINLHTSVTSRQALDAMDGYMGQHGFEKWHGNIWIPAFAHRSRIFWNLAKAGWDSDLCGGGMVWNPRLEPYKNAITNQLFISASASMHLYFPGDGNRSPFFSDTDTTSPEFLVRPSAQDVFEPQDPAFLRFAREGYSWLQSSGMMNSKGLYIDGFHISGWADPRSTNKRCDVRNEQVYTYNQGVILTGQLNLWKITGNYSYVEDGHRLIRSVIQATGWHLGEQRPADRGVPRAHGPPHRWKGRRLPRWHGIGRAGVMEEMCDSRGDCSQDSQTFKGIFFHHLTTFCGASLSWSEFVAPQSETPRHIRTHTHACKSYLPWLEHNRHAMMETRDGAGRVGMWWTAGLLGLNDEMPPDEDFADMVNPDAVDYRNGGVPDDPMWRRPTPPIKPPSVPKVPLPGVEKDDRLLALRESLSNNNEGGNHKRDLNDRGRGRTVETQGGGLALLRAYWEISDGPGTARAQATTTGDG